MAANADHQLLYGLIALQVGLIDQAQLLAAFQAWARDKDRPLADHLADRGGLGADGRAAIEAMVALHVSKYGGDTEKSLASIPAGRSTRESLIRIGGPVIEATLTRLGSRSTDLDGLTDLTANYAVGTATSDGQRFRVLRPHAKGGLGAVFVALDSELNREVALKQILDNHADDPVSRQRFLIEAEITGGLEHPGIVPVYGLGTYAGGRPYYAMRFIRGESLKEAIRPLPRATESPKARPGRPLARAPQAPAAVHRRLQRDRVRPQPRGIAPRHQAGQHHRRQVRRDAGRRLGPGQAAGPGRAGLASGERTLVPSSASGSAETLPGSALGTPAYMSPEQAGGDLDRLGPRSRRLQPGRDALLPADRASRRSRAKTSDEVLRKVQRGEFVRPRQLDPSIDPALEAVCLKAMAHEPGGPLRLAPGAGRGRRAVDGRRGGLGPP